MRAGYFGLAFIRLHLLWRFHDPDFSSLVTIAWPFLVQSLILRAFNKTTTCSFLIRYVQPQTTNRLHHGHSFINLFSYCDWKPSICNYDGCLCKSCTTTTTSIPRTYTFRFTCAEIRENTYMRIFGMLPLRRCCRVAVVNYLLAKSIVQFPNKSSWYLWTVQNHLLWIVAINACYSIQGTCRDTP